MTISRGVWCVFGGLVLLLTTIFSVRAFDKELHEEFVEVEQFVALSQDVRQMAQSIEQNNNMQLYVFLNKRIAELRQVRGMRQLTHQEETELAQLEMQLHRLKKKMGMK